MVTTTTLMERDLAHLNTLILQHIDLTQSLGFTVVFNGTGQVKTIIRPEYKPTKQLLESIECAEYLRDRILQERNRQYGFKQSSARHSCYSS